MTANNEVTDAYRREVAARLRLYVRRHGPHSRDGYGLMPMWALTQFFPMPEPDPNSYELDPRKSEENAGEYVMTRLADMIDRPTCFDLDDDPSRFTCSACGSWLVLRHTTGEDPEAAACTMPAPLGTVPPAGRRSSMADGGRRQVHSALPLPSRIGSSPCPGPLLDCAQVAVMESPLGQKDWDCRHE